MSLLLYRRKSIRVGICACAGFAFSYLRECEIGDYMGDGLDNL